MHHDRRRLAILIVMGVIVAATVGVGIYGLVRDPGRSGRPTAPLPASAAVPGRPATRQPSATTTGPLTLPKTDNPIVYAKAVAAALFDWDTTTGYAPSDYTSPVLADADPSGHEAPDAITAHAADEDPVPRPINWRTLSSEDAEYEWLALNEWVDWLRHEFALPATVIPPYWHRHPELVWELSALHLHWLGAYDPDQHASAPIGWLADFHATQARLREAVAACGTRLDRDRPTRHTTWPGETPEPPAVETPITNRDEDFVAFVINDVNRRAEAENQALRHSEDDGID